MEDRLFDEAALYHVLLSQCSERPSYRLYGNRVFMVRRAQGRAALMQTCRTPDGLLFSSVCVQLF